MYLDSVVFLLFLLIHLSIGIRGAMGHTSGQYTVKGLTTASMVAAILTVAYGGEVLCSPLNIDCLLLLAGSAISYFIIGNLLSHRLHLFLNNGSMAEMMGQFYGKNIRTIVALSGILYSAAAIAMQLKALSIAISWLFTIKVDYSLLIAATFIIFSVGSNGIECLMLVRVMRCATFGILLPIIAWILWKNIVDQYNADQFHLAWAIKRSWNGLIHVHASPLHYITCLMAFAIPTLYPAQVERILACTNAIQIKRSFNYTGFFSLSINLLLLWVALLLNKTCGKLIISDCSLTILDAYIGLKGLFMIGIAALTISTASAHLHAATVLIVNDIPDLFKWGSRPAMHFNRYRLFVGLISTLLALYTKELFQIVWMAIILFKSVVSIPLLVSLIGARLHPYAVLTGMLASAATIIVWTCFTSDTGMHSLLPSMLIHLLSLMVAQTFFKKYKQKSDQPPLTVALSQEEAAKSSPLWRQFARYVLDKIKIWSLWDYLQQQLPKGNLHYVLFSFYIILTGYGSFYTFSSNPIWSGRLEAMILFPTLFIATFFLTYASIPPKPYVSKIVSVIWPLSNIYFLFLVGSIMLVLSKFAHLQAIIFMLNLSLAIFINSLMVVLLRCIISAIVVWMLLPYIGSHVRWIDTFLNLNISVVCAILMLFFLLGGLLYHNTSLRKLLLTIQALRSEQEEQNARQFFSKQQVEALAYESSYVISQLHHQLLRWPKSEDRSLAYQEQATRLKKYFNSIFRHLKHNLHLATNWISIDQLLAECFDTIKINNIYDTPYVITHTEHLYIQCDIERIKTLIINSLYACKSYKSVNGDQRKDIYIYIHDTQLGYRLTLLKGKIQKVNAVSFVITTAMQRPVIRPIYKAVEMADIQILDKEKEQIDWENQLIVHAHYGYHGATYSDSEITHLYVIPVNVQEITKAFAALSPVVYTQNVALDPISMEAELTFLEQIKQKKGLDVETIMDALQLIKIYYTTQRRKTGELFYLHPMAAASILLSITDDFDVIIAGLVHDVVQNTPLTEAGLTTLLGSAITEMVLSAVRLEKELPIQKNDYTTYIQGIISHTNHRAILIRLADALHNARTIGGHSIEKRIEKATLIQRFYVPLAAQMNLTDIADELHLHASKVLNISILEG